MATKRYLGNQVRRYEIQSVTITAVGVGDTASVTFNGKAVIYKPITGDTTATVASGLAAALTTAEDGEFRQFNIAIDSTNSSKIVFTETVAGRFMSADGNTALTAAGSGSTTLTVAVEQAGKSPLDGSDTVNWSGGALPGASGDDWYFENAPFGMQYNLAALSGKSADSVRVFKTFGGNKIGLPFFAEEGYAEYRGGRLALTACTLLDLDLPDAAGFEFYRFNVGSALCTANIRGSQLGGVGSEVVDWIGTHASNVITVSGASIRIAPYVGDVATVLTLTLLNSAATIGSGTTLTTANLKNSSAEFRAGCTTLNLDGGSVTTKGTSAFTTITVDNGGTLNSLSTGTIGTLVLGPGCVADFSALEDALTITNKVLMHTGSSFLDPNGRVTLTAGWNTVKCPTGAVTVNFGTNRDYTVA